MDIELARTFLEIVKTRSFVRAAEQLNLSQTAVSARIRALEPMFLQLWQRARHQVAVPPGRRAVLTIGGELSLSHPWLVDWLHWMRRAAPDVALHVQVGLPESLSNQVSVGALDVAVMYAPQYRPGARVCSCVDARLGGV